MTTRLPRQNYTRAEMISDGIVHLVGLIAATGAAPVLVVLAATVNGSGRAVAGASIYVATLLLMLLFSALYNMIASPRWSWLLRRLDHSAIYLKIAGTFTPFALIGGASATFLGGIWGVALAGVSIKMISPERFRLLGLWLYLGMGWIGVVLGWAHFVDLPGPVLALMATGGALYTLGVAFYLWDRLPFHNTIWHVFVLVASLIFYAAVLGAVLLA